MKKEREHICIMTILDNNFRQVDAKFIGIFKEKNKAEEAYSSFLTHYIEQMVDEGEEIDDIDCEYDFEMFIFEI